MGQATSLQIRVELRNETPFELVLACAPGDCAVWGSFTHGPMSRVPTGFDGLAMRMEGFGVNGCELRAVYYVGRRQTLELSANCPASSLGGRAGAAASVGGRGGVVELLFGWVLERAPEAEEGSEPTLVVARATLRDATATASAGPPPALASRAEGAVVQRMAERTARMLQRAIAASLRGSLSRLREDLNETLREQSAKGGGGQRGVVAEIVDLRLPEAVEEYPLLTPLPMEGAEVCVGGAASDRWLLSWTSHSLLLAVKLRHWTPVGSFSSTVRLSRVTIDAEVHSSGSSPMRVWFPCMPALDLDLHATGPAGFAVRTGVVRRAIETALRRRAVHPNALEL